MRLRRGRLCQGSADARPRHRLPGVWADCDHLRRPHCALGLPPTFPRGSLPLRCGPRRSSRRSSGPFSRFTQRASTSCHAACDLRPADACWTCSASVGTPGRLRVGQVGWNLLAGARPPLGRRGAWKEEKGVPLSPCTISMRRGLPPTSSNAKAGFFGRDRANPVYASLLPGPSQTQESSSEESLTDHPESLNSAYAKGNSPLQPRADNRGIVFGYRGACGYAPDGRMGLDDRGLFS